MLLNWLFIEDKSEYIYKTLILDITKYLFIK